MLKPIVCKNQNQMLNQKSKTKMSSFLIALQTNVSRGNPKNYSSNTNGSEKKKKTCPEINSSKFEDPPRSDKSKEIKPHRKK